MRLLILVVLQGLLLAPLMGQSPKVYVFLPSNIRPHILQQTLSKACPDLEVTVFGRFREFQRMVTQAPPDAILSLEPVTQQFEEFQPFLKGALKGQSREAYALLSVDHQVDTKTLSEKTLGVVDLLGRRQMNSYLSELLAGAKPRVKTVTKFEDLLTLLQFQDVDAIFIPRSKVDYYQKRTRLNLQITNLKGVTIGLPVLSIRRAQTEADKVIPEQFNAINHQTNSKLGVDQWIQP